MSALVIRPLPGAGRILRLAAWLRGLVSRRAILRLAGLDVVVLQGRVLPVRAVPLGVARALVPAIVRCSQAMAAWRMDETLYDDLVQVLALGLGIPQADVEQLTVSLWDLAPVVERIAVANGLPVMEAGRPEMGKLMAALTGTTFMPPSSAPPAGPGSMSINA